MRNIKHQILFLFINLLVVLNTIAQPIEVKEEQKVCIDHLENIYLIDNENFSLVSDGQKKEYQNNFLGSIFSADISNPLRILVFHKDANQIVFLNNELSIIGEAISLDDINLPEVSAACASQINGFWVYNDLNHKIEFYNSKVEKVHSSKNLSDLMQDSDEIKEILMFNEQVYLRTEQSGILIFDMFATYVKTLPIKNTSSFQVLGRSILYTQGKQIFEYSFDKLLSSLIFESESPINYARLFNRNLYYLNNTSLLLKDVTHITTQ